MGSELEVEWFDPNCFPNAPTESRGAWVRLYAGDSIEHAQEAFMAAGAEGRVVRLTWRPS